MIGLLQIVYYIVCSCFGCFRQHFVNIIWNRYEIGWPVTMVLEEPGFLVQYIPEHTFCPILYVNGTGLLSFPHKECEIVVSELFCLYDIINSLFIWKTISIIICLRISFFSKSKKNPPLLNRKTFSHSPKTWSRHLYGITIAFIGGGWRWLVRVKMTY